jgi:multisubunit Na+/H+ antiporter MnhB subunit
MAAVMAVLRAVRDAMQRRAPRHPVRALAGVVARVALAALILGYPALIGYGCTAMRFWHPDLALVGGAVLATAIARVVWLFRVRSATEPETRPPAARADRPAERERIEVA